MKKQKLIFVVMIALFSFGCKPKAAEPEAAPEAAPATSAPTNTSDSVTPIAPGAGLTGATPMAGGQNLGGGSGGGVGQAAKDQARRAAAGGPPPPAATDGGE